MLRDHKVRSVAVLSFSLLFGSSMVATNAWAQPGGAAHDCPCEQGKAGWGPGTGHGAGRGHGHGGGHGRGGAQREDMATIHGLFADPTIKRAVREIPGGVETLTESSTPEGAAMIQKHVAAMHARLTDANPIHARDPLFAELFAHASEITMSVENTARGVKVRETASDPYVTKLIRSHAMVVTKFLENGRREMHVDHPVPAP